MKVRYDPEADAMYITFADTEIADTRKVDERTILDLDAEGEVVGIELLDASNRSSSLSTLSVELADMKPAQV